jgi:cell fate regulator YaaT (PSP1 superfamily)
VRPITRKADFEDLSILERNRRKEDEAYKLCIDKIKERNLDMKLVDVEYILSGGKAIFYFTAEGRVDFRALVRDLAQQLHTRIEMRQIGVRDESKMLGGIGPCGRELCCAQHLKAFEPVSIRMAKDQNLALNPQKVSGLCGRLMCCLAYEHSTYEEIWGQIPKIGKKVQTPKGEGKIMSVDIRSHKVRTLIGDGVEVFTIDEIKALNTEIGGRAGQGGRRDDGQKPQDQEQGGPPQGQQGQRRQDRQGGRERPWKRDDARQPQAVKPEAPAQKMAEPAAGDAPKDSPNRVQAAKDRQSGPAEAAPKAPPDRPPPPHEPGEPEVDST